MPTPSENAALIMDARARMEAITQEIQAIATAHIPDFHFLDHYVSTFWTCSTSPIGMCVFTFDDLGRLGQCRYCNELEERK